MQYCGLQCLWFVSLYGAAIKHNFGKKSHKFGEELTYQKVIDIV